MGKLNFIFLIVGIILFQAWRIKSQCLQVRGLNGTISDTSNTRDLQKCWKISVPTKQFIRLRVVSLNLNSQSCSNAYLRITVNGTSENYTFCHADANKNPVTALSDVVIAVYYRDTSGWYRNIGFRLQYELQDVECARKDSFHCTNHSCISKHQVCDGVKDCENGADEVGCETGVISIPGVLEARNKTIDWLKNKRTSWGWGEYTPRVVTALFLAGAANFNGTNLEEELMAKQTELKAAVALMKNSISNEQLSTFINALLVTCHNPRHFYGQNLLRRLKKQLESPTNFTHPIVYLALCSANESWPVRAAEDLQNIFTSDSEYYFIRDIQAFAVMAVSCSRNNEKLLTQSENSTLINEYKKIIKHFKQHQLSDGSFGNVHTTALVAQALLSSGEENSKDWKLNNTIKYLIRELNSSSTEFLAAYLTLPILNGKSLSDIVKIDCSSSPRRQRKRDILSDINDYTGPKIRVQYSLFVGDEKDVIHTISLRVPENFTAYDVMQLAEVEDQKYRFEWKEISNKKYVYRIGKIANDSEGGKFWLLYIGSTNTTAEIRHSTSSPDELVLEEGDHLIMWYKKAEI